MSDDSVDTEDSEDKSPRTNFGIYFLLLNIYFHNPSEGSQPSVMGTGSKDLSVETIDGKLTVGTKRRVDADELTSSEATGIYWLVNFYIFS